MLSQTAFFGILIVPFISFLILLFCRNLLYKSLAAAIALASTAICLCLVLFVLKPEGLLNFPWFEIGQYASSLQVLINKETILMLAIVQIIALLVQLFSVSYMAEDDGFVRYFAFIQFFVFAMNGIILAGNLLILYFFWELVGLASYLLIGFWYQKDTAIRASKKAFLFNRIGDAGLLVGIGFLFYYNSSFGYSQQAIDSPAMATLVGILLFCGTIGKSAQFPLQLWLPDAMEGPTPVSALIHAATMVAAGVFLLIRIFPILTPDALFFIAVIGAITMLWGGVVALFQDDIKKSLAFSTISQLGLMVLAVGLGAPNAAFFHLTTHAFFKAGLFLGAGAIIHGLHTQNMQDMGGLAKKMPVLFVCYAISAAALVGVPFFSGFVSKEIILNVATQKPIFLILILINTSLTAFYMTRQVYLVFLKPKETAAAWQQDWRITLPLLILAIGSLGIVFSLNPFEASEAWFAQYFEMNEENHASFLPYLSVLMMLIGGFLGLRMAKNEHKSAFQMLLMNQFNSNEFVQRAIVKPTFLLAAFSTKIDLLIDTMIDGFANLQLKIAELIKFIDDVFVDGVVDGISFTVSKIGKWLSQFQQKTSVMTMLVGVLLIILFWLIS